MAFEEEDFLQLSGLQHFKFCRRQWALIHVEHQWAENFRTTDGALLHENAHDKDFRESRGDLFVTRAMNVFSREMGLSGECDVVEFRRNEVGVSLAGKAGLWQPYPVEYKRGGANAQSGNTLQLCAQAMCLEEMLLCAIPEGALYYHETRKREPVIFTDELRREVRESAAEMHALYARGDTPKVKPDKGCAACSLQALCLPALIKAEAPSAYLRKKLGEDV